MLLAILIWLFTIVTTIAFASRHWWFPESVSSHGEVVDGQFVLTLVVTGIVFILAQVGLGWVLFRYRDTGQQRAVYSHGNNKLEVLWTLLTATVFFLMVLPGQKIWADLYINPAAENALQIEVTGQQFAWNIRYPGPDGRFGTIKPELIDDAAGNPLGLDFNDPAAADDLVLPTMAIPVNRPIELLLRSKDVTHAFSVRELRIKQDTVPGLLIPLRFTAIKTGSFEIACMELCGLGHHRMRSFIEILTESDYQDWLREMAEE